MLHSYLNIFYIEEVIYTRNVIHKDNIQSHANALLDWLPGWMSSSCLIIIIPFTCIIYETFFLLYHASFVYQSVTVMSSYSPFWIMIELLFLIVMAVTNSIQFTFFIYSSNIPLMFGCHCTNYLILFSLPFYSFFQFSVIFSIWLLCVEVF